MRLLKILGISVRYIFRLLLGSIVLVMTSGIVLAAVNRCPEEMNSDYVEFVGATSKDRFGAARFRDAALGHQQGMKQMVRTRQLLVDYYSTFKAFRLDDVTDKLRKIEAKRNSGTNKIHLLLYQYGDDASEISTLDGDRRGSQVGNALRIFLVSSEGLVAYECLRRFQIPSATDLG